MLSLFTKSSNSIKYTLKKQTKGLSPRIVNYSRFNQVNEMFDSVKRHQWQIYSTKFKKIGTFVFSKIQWKINSHLGEINNCFKIYILLMRDKIKKTTIESIMKNENSMFIQFYNNDNIFSNIVYFWWLSTTKSIVVNQFMISRLSIQ